MKTTNHSNVGQRTDEHWTQVALTIGMRGEGRVAPNPSVGCVIVKDNIVVGRGWTQPGGRPHAETVALDQAGALAKAATAYVTLEPCSHHGVTPPCANSLIKAGISRVVIAMSDPDKRVNGNGVKLLQDAGITVTENICAAAAQLAHQGFVLVTTQNRPKFSLKLAVSSDNKIAKANGDSKWITGLNARQFGHMMRAKHDAILVGVNTVIADDPSLTCRIGGLEDRSPIRIVLDTHLKTPISSKLVQTASDLKTIIITEKKDTHGKFNAYGVDVHTVNSTRDMSEVASKIANLDITSVMIEGGSRVAASFASANLVDYCAVFRAPKPIGANGIDAIAGLSLETYLADPSFMIENTRNLDPDVLTTYRKIK